MRKIAVSGTRETTSLENVVQVCGILTREFRKGDHVLVGDAKGVDFVVRTFCKHAVMDFIEFKADWEKLGSKAGPIRNRKMFEEGKPDLLLAFPGPNSRGTYHTISLANQYGVETLVFYLT